MPNLNIRCSEDELKEIKSKAKKAGLSLTEYVKFSCFSINIDSQIKVKKIYEPKEC